MGLPVLLEYKEKLKPTFHDEALSHIRKSLDPTLIGRAVICFDQ